MAKGFGAPLGVAENILDNGCEHPVSIRHNIAGIGFNAYHSNAVGLCFSRCAWRLPTQLPGRLEELGNVPVDLGQRRAG